MKRLGMDTVKYQNQEKKCFENTEILREKNTSLPWTQKLNEETLTEIFQDNEQLGIWKVENTLQNFTPESEKQNEERKRNEHRRKQEASKEKVSELQRETTLHEDQLHDYQNKSENKIDGIINVQTQFYDVIKKLQARNYRYRLMLENKYLELINETNHLKEQLDQYGEEKAEEVSIKQDIFIKSLQRNTQSDTCLWLNVES